MWKILQYKYPEDWVIATGKTTTIRDFVIMAFGYIGIELEFFGQGINEKGVVKSCANDEYKLELGKEVISIDPSYFRPTEVDVLIGDSSKAKNKLNWAPRYNLQDVVNDMMQSDLKLMQDKKNLKRFK